MREKPVLIVSTAFGILTQVIEDIHPGTLENLHQESVVSLTAGGNASSRYEQLAEILVPGTDETIESCYHWFDFTRSFDVIHLFTLRQSLPGSCLSRHVEAT